MLSLICLALNVYWIILIVRIILSWVSAFGTVPEALTPVVRVVYDLTEPVMGFFRRYIPPIGGFDISVIFVFIGIGIIQAAIGCG